MAVQLLFLALEQQRQLKYNNEIMAEIIRMPRLSDTMEEGNIIGWLMKVGDTVKPGDILAEVETDKATMELENYVEGTILHIGVGEGAVPVDAVIAIVGDKSDNVEEILAGLKAEESKQAAPAKEEPAPVAAPAKKAAPAPAPVATKPAAAPAASSNGRVLASPLAKRLAEENNINIANVPGTGEGGRVVKADIESYVASGGAQASSASYTSDGLADFQYGDVAVSQMRKTIARRLSESKFGAPHFYLTMEIDMDNAIAARKMLNQDEDNRISYNDMVVKACASALRKHPAINASWFGDKMTFHKDINIGVAVAVEDGLLVPVIKQADAKPLNVIWSEIRDLAGKAKTKKLGMDEMTGNTFTISNLGMFGITEFTAIVNPPDACILAVGTIVQKPVVKDGAIVVGNTMKVTLSCDHRIVDGAKGAAFLQTLKDYMENPMKLLR